MQDADIDLIANFSYLELAVYILQFQGPIGFQIIWLWDNVNKCTAPCACVRTRMLFERHSLLISTGDKRS